MSLPYPTEMGPYRAAIETCWCVDAYMTQHPTDFRAGIEALDAFQLGAVLHIDVLLSQYSPFSEEAVALALSHNWGMEKVRWLRGRLSALAMGVPMQPPDWHPENN